jgi:hypothetical protein
LQARKDAVVRQHDHARVLQRHQHKQGGARLGLIGMRLVVFQCGCVAMVAVGDEHVGALEELLKRRDDPIVGYFPATMLDPVVGRLAVEVRLAAVKVVAKAVDDLTLFVGKDAEHGRELSLCRFRELVAVVDPALDYLLVSEDAALGPVELFDFKPAEEAPPTQGLAVDLVDLLVGVDRRLVDARQRAFVEPLLHCLAGLVIRLVRAERFGRGDWQVDGNDVFRVAFQQLLLGPFVEHVVGRRDFAGEIALIVDVVANGGDRVQ